MLLAIDTATRYLGLALYHQESLVAEQMWRTGNKHNLILAPSIEHLLDVCDVNADDLTMIAVANGPGSYTGLRIGVAFAKGMASVRQLPLIGVNTLDIIAHGQHFVNTRQRLLAILPAGRGRIIAGEYRVKRGQWTPVAEPVITNWDDLLGTLDHSAYRIAGELDAAGIEAVTGFDHPDISLHLIDTAARARRPAVLAQTAWERYHAGESGDFLPAKLAPVYLKSPG